MESLPENRTVIANLLLATKTEASVTRRKQLPDGTYQFFKVQRPTSPIDFPVNDEEFALKLHENNPEAPLSEIYINLRNLPTSLLALVGENIADQNFQLTPDLCAGIPNAGDPITEVFSQASGIAKINIFAKDVTGAGRKIVPLENVLRGDAGSDRLKLILVDDLITAADTKLEAIAAAESLGYQVIGVAVLMDRQQGGTKQLAKKGYHLYAAMQLIPTLNYYLSSHQISEGRYDKVMSYLGKS